MDVNSRNILQANTPKYTTVSDRSHALEAERYDIDRLSDIIEKCSDSQLAE